MDFLCLSPINMPPVVIVVLVLTAAVFVYQFILYPLFLSPLSRVPGPKLAALSTLYLNYHWYRETAIPLIEKLHEKYGPIVRIGPSELVINDPEPLPLIYGPRSSLMKCPNFATLGNHDTPNTFASITNEEHKQRRKTIAQAYGATSLYSNTTLLEFMRNRLERVNSAAAAAHGRTLDVFALSNQFAVDNITFQVYGDSLNLLDGHNLQQAENIRNTIIGAIPMMRCQTILNILCLRPLTFLLPAFIKNSLDSQAELETMNLQQIRKVINSKGATVEPRKTTLGSIRYHVEQDTTVTETHVASECLDNVIAGSDAPAAAITYLLYELALPGNQKYQARLRKELDSLSLPMDFNEVSRLSFLNRLIYESLRLHPPGPGSMAQRWTTEQTAFTVHGKTYQVPPNTLVAAGAYSLHLSKDIFGQDAKQFRPERWEEKDKSRLQKMNEAWVPFGTGTRACIGQPLALLEVKLFVAALLRGRSVRLPPDADPDDMEAQLAVVIRPKAVRCDLVINEE